MTAPKPCAGTAKPVISYRGTRTDRNEAFCSDCERYVPVVRDEDGRHFLAHHFPAQEKKQ